MGESTASGGFSKPCPLSWPIYFHFFTPSAS